MGFSTDGDSWSFSFDDVPEKPTLPDKPNMTTGYLSGKGCWENWSDPVVYECDSLMRQFLESKQGDGKWARTSKLRRFTFGLMFEVLFGRKYDPSIDFKYINKLSKVMAYYSSRIQKEGMIRGKRYGKPVYTLSPKRYNSVPPYSLRLRLEWLEEQGILPTWQNMRAPSDSLKPGHARNPRTDENMERRREQARQRYNKRYRDRKH